METGGGSPPICCRRLYRSVLGQRLKTSTIEADAFASCSDVLENTGISIGETTSCEFRRAFRRTESYHPSNACLRCGKLALPHPTLSRVCWNIDHAQGAGKVEGDGHSFCSPCDNDPTYIHPARTFPGRLQDLFIALLSKFKYLGEDQSLCDILPADLVDAFDGQPACTNAPSAGEGEKKQDLGARIGILLFFRLLGSLRRNKNTAGILKLIRQVPSMTSNTPMLSLSPHRLSRENPTNNQLPVKGPRSDIGGLGVAAAAGIPDGVVEAITSAAEELLSGEHDLSDKQQGDVLEALVGLAVKRGSLAHCLRVVKLLLRSTPAADKPCPIQGVGHQLKELETTQTSAPVGAGVRHLDWPLSSKGCQAGTLVSLDEKRDQSAECNACNDRHPRPPFVTPALRGVQVIKVDSTASHNAALTADGELLTWSCTAAIARQSIPPSILDRSRNVQQWRPESRVDRGCPAMDDAVCTCSRCHSSSVCPTSGENAEDPTTPMVWQVLACKPSVTDVACGQKHTLALLETGQVFSWGSGRNGQLGLGHTEDRPFACPVEGLQGIDIEAVFCGVFHSMAVCSSGAPYAWGNNSSGQCGRKDSVAVNTMADLSGLLGTCLGEHRPTSIYPGLRRYGCGWHHLVNDNHNQGIRRTLKLSPRSIEGLEEFPVTAMAGGWDHTLALSSCGAVFTIGGGYRDTCSTGEPPAVGGSVASSTTGGVVVEQDGIIPVRVAGDALGSTPVIKIASGWHHCMAVTDDGVLYSWGSGRGGQLGHGDTEPRHSPTRVAFFSSPAGDRVCSIVGGRICSAATTADGRLFKWGLSSKGGYSCADEYSGEESSYDPNEEHRSAALEASIPRQIAGVGMANSRVLRPGGGANIDMVLVQLTSTEDPKFPLVGVRKEEKLRGHSTNDLLLRWGLNVPDDPSQPVGRVETAVALLRHFERLAAAHTPRDFTTDVERSVRQAVRSKRSVKGRLSLERAALVRPLHVADSSSTARTDQHRILATLGINTPQEESLCLAPKAPMPSAQKASGSQETLATVCGTSVSVVPFCVDTSRKTFCSFLALMQGIRESGSSVGAPSTHMPNGTQATSFSVAFEGIDNSQKSSGDIEPESSSPGESSPSGFLGARKLDGQPNLQHETALAGARNFFLASKSVEIEVWRCTLKLLKVNLFHLTRAAAVQHSYRDNSSRGTTPDFYSLDSKHTPDTQAGGAEASREGNCIHSHRAVKEGGLKKNDVGQESVLKSTENIESASKDDGGGTPGKKGTILPGLGQEPEDRQSESDKVEDMDGVIQEIHTALRALLEDDFDGECPETTKAAKDMQVEAAEAFNAGFSVFFPSNLARIRLLQDIVKTISTKTAPPFLPQDTLENTENKEKHRRSKKMFRQPRSAPKSKSTFVQVAVEGLSRENYAAALVAWAFNSERSTADKEVGTGVGVTTDVFGTEELDTAMQSLLSYCVDDLNDRLRGLAGASDNVERSCSHTRGGGREEKASGCPHSRLLLALQVHVTAYWGNTDDKAAHTSAARKLSLAHASRLFQESVKVFTSLAGDRDETGVGASDQRDSRADVDVVRKSFVALLPLLCASIVAIPVEWKICVSQASALLPIMIPLIGAVDRFNRSVCAAASLKNENASSSSSRSNIPSSTCWLNGLEEALAMLSSDLACGLMDMNPAPNPADLHSQRPFGAERADNEKQGKDVADLLLTSSPFLTHDQENFDWSSAEGDSLKLDCLDFPQALEVIAFQERVVQERCDRCDRSPMTPVPRSGLKQTASTPSLNKPHAQHSWSNGRRRASSDNAAKLSPIGLVGSASADEFSGQGSLCSAPTRSMGSLGSLGLGDESGHSGSQGSVRRGGGMEAEIHGGKGSAATGRQLDSIVDEDRAEGFIQDLLCGQGVAQALYQWMTEPLESQLPVLHATSLATQGQGWGSYQALSSQPATASRVDETAGNHRRRRSRVLSSGVDAAGRALVAVMIKCNGAVTEAATFARCRLDRSSSPPPTLKLVAVAAVEVREVLAGLVDSLEEERDERVRADGKACCDKMGEAGDRGCDDQSCPGHRSKSATDDVASAAATFAAIVRNCRFLLKCTLLPPIGLMRQADVSPCRRQGSASHIPAEEQQIRRQLSHTLQRWSRNTHPSNTTLKPCSFTPTKELVGIVQHMAKGRVEHALSAAVASQKPPLPPRSASLESLLAFAASPIVFGALKTRMRSHALRAKVRASGFRLAHIILQEVQSAAARRQIGVRLAHSLRISTGDADKSALFNGTEMGLGYTATTGLVCSAFIELFRHVVNETKQLNSGCHWQDKDVWRSTTLLVFLPLLQTLTTMLPQSFLHHVASISPEETNAPGLTDLNAGASSYRTEHGVSTATSNQGRSGCAGRASSNPSVVRPDTDVLKPTPMLEREAFSVVLEAVPVLGAVLSGRGDVLADGAWVLGGASMNDPVHHAAWRALNAVGIQVCSSTPTWARQASGGGGGSVGHAHQAASGGRSGSSSTEIERHSISREWWLAVQAIISVVFHEVARVQERLEQFLRSRQVEEELLAETGAMRLILGPVSFPLPTMLTFPGPLENDVRKGFASSFWVLVPECTAHLTGQRCALGDCSPALHSKKSKPHSRWMVFTRTCQSSKKDKTELGEYEECPGIFLTQLKTTKHRSTPLNDGDEDGFYVEMILEKDIKPKRSEEPNMTQGDDGVENGYDLATASTASAVVGADGLRETSKGAKDSEDAGSNGQAFATDRIFSKKPLTARRWTHVCCAYSSIGGGGNDAGGDAVPRTFVTISFDGIIVAKHVCSSQGVAYENGATPQSSQASAHGIRSADKKGRHEAESCSPGQECGQRQERPAICDLRWHSRNVSTEQARQLANSGFPGQREDAQHAVESYSMRLVAFTEEIAASSQRVASSLSSPRWLLVWFKLMMVADQHAQIAIVRLLRPLLCASDHTTSDSVVDGARADSGAKMGGSLYLDSCEQQFDDRAVVDHLCGLLGGPLIPLVRCQWGSGISRGSDTEQANTIDEQSKRTSNPVRQELAVVSEIVLLLRSLIEQAPNHWQEHVFAALTDGLATTVKGELSSLAKSAESEKNGGSTDRSVQSQTWLGAAAAAVYIGGGHIEGPRLGARVTLLPRHTHPTATSSTEAGGSARGKTIDSDEILRDVYSNICVSARVVVLGEEAVKTECRGTIVGLPQCEGIQPSFKEGIVFVAVDKQYEDCLDDASIKSAALQDHFRSRTGDHDSIVQPSCRVIAVSPRQIAFQAEVREPATSFLLNPALPSVLSLLESLAIPNINNGFLVDLEESSGAVPGNKLGASIVNAHIRCRLMRALAVQLRDPHQARAALHGQLLPPILALGSSILASAVVLALGSDAAVAFGRQGTFAPVVLSLGQARITSASSSSLLADLEAASQVVWSRLSSEKRERGSSRTPQQRARSVDDVKGSEGDNRAARPALEVLGGEALVQGNRVTASSHFPTLRLSHVRVDSGLARGRWYYEVTLLTGGLMQLGWAGPLFQCSPIRGQGVGDHMHSWAFDGFRQKRWCVSSAPYGNQWRAGDVVGVFLDAGLEEMRFSLNGRDLGVAFVGVDTEGLYPAASMNVGQAASFNFGYSPFLYSPADSSGGSPVQPISEAVPNAILADPIYDNPIEPGERHLRNDTATSIGGGRDGSDSPGHSHQNDIHGLSPGRIRQRHDDGSDLQTNRSGGGVGGGGGGGGGGERGGGGGGGGKGRGGGGGRTELERQGLVETLIGMGFPIEWAIRAAERSGAVMSESAATAWIIDRLEIENTKMEEEMGNMDTCEGDSVGGKSGTGDEYNDDDERESDDGNADVGGFGYELEATGIDTGGRGEEGRTDDDTGDRRWHDMYSAVRRSFLARRTGQSPATAAAGPLSQHGQGAGATLGAAAEASWTGNDLTASSQTVALLAAQEASAEGVVNNGQHALMKAALSADEGDLPSLSLVLDMALSILFARAAIVNLLSHVRAAINGSPQCPPRARGLFSVGPAEPKRSWWWVQPPRTEGGGSPTSVGDTVSHEASMSHSWGSDGGDCGLEMKIAQALLETMAVSENQRRIVDLTKECMSWHSPSRRNTTDSAFPTPSSPMDTPTGTASTPTTWRNRTLEEPCFHLASEPLGLYPGSCALAMGSFFELALIFIKSGGRHGAWFSAKPSMAQCAKDETPSANSRQSDEAVWITSTATLTRLVTLFVAEAVSSIEHCPTEAEDRHRNGGVNSSTSSDQGSGTSKPLSSSSNILWAMWVLDTLLLLEITYGGMEEPAHGHSDQGGDDSIGPIGPVTGEDTSIVSEDVRSLGLAVASARSPRAFAAVLRIATATGNSTGEGLRVLACSVCAHMLDLSRHAPSFRRSAIGGRGEEASADTTTVSELYNHTDIPTCGSAKDEYALSLQERSLAREFSTRLRTQVSMQSLGSPSLQSQLELLAQWELRRSIVSGKRALPSDGARIHRLHDEDCKKEGPTSEGNQTWTDKHSVPEVWTYSTSELTDSWDVATSSFAGVEEASNNSEMSVKTNGIVGPKRSDTAESEASALSTVPTASRKDSSVQNQNISLLVETASATSVTVSWGGWLLDADHGPELQVGIGSNGIAYPMACGREVGASDLAQALRSKLSHATSRRQDQEPGLVLKVRASGLWGSEPYHIAALDLDSCGCLKVHGLAADTHYVFRLEHRVVPSSPPRAPPAESTGTLDDEHSCFPLEASMGGVDSAGEATADPLVADAVDGASRVLTGLTGNHDAGAGGGAAASTTEKHRQNQADRAPSTRAAAGRSLHPRDSDLFTTTHTIAGDDARWPSIGSRQQQPYGTLENRNSVTPNANFAVGRGETTILTTLSVSTPPEVPFMLDADGCGPNLRLTKSNMTVTNNGRKKWSAVRATRGFSSGVHRWKVRVDRCVSKNVFVGVVSPESRLSNYVGSDRSGWGYLANKAIWHNKGKVRSYGDLFREGDTIGVLLNMDLGTLRFARNGRDLGVAVQGLEGTLYPAFSMYNRNDQLTFIPPEDHAAPMLTSSPVGRNDNSSGAGPTRVGGAADTQVAQSDVVYGTFIAECVVRRASKALEILGVLTEVGGFESPAGVCFIEDIRLRLIRWSRGEQGRLCSSTYACVPVNLDTSQRARQHFFGLGAGDRIISADGEAVVLGATKHSVWVSVEAASPPSARPPALDRGLLAWDSEISDKNQEDSCRGHKGHTSAIAVAASGSSPSHRSMFGRLGSKTTSWSRSVVRQIVSHPEEFTVSRCTTPEESDDPNGKNRRGDAQHDVNVRTAAAVAVDLIRTGELRILLARWTPAMDEELARRLDQLAESMAVLTPLELPLEEVMKNLPGSVLAFPLTTSVAPVELWARTTLLLHVNELVLPLLPLVSTSSAERGPLGALLHKCRHLILAATKLSLLRRIIRRTVAESQWEAGAENGTARTISVNGVRALPRTPRAGHTNAAEAFPSPRLSWVQRTREVEKSVFGQVTRHLANSPPQVWSEAEVAFSVELTDASVAVQDGTAATAAGLQLPDEQALYRGLFWQVCAEVCSPPISMFVSTTPAEDTKSASEATVEATFDAHVASNANEKTRTGGAAARDVPDKALLAGCGATPDPLFVSRSPNIYMDPARISLYRSLGLIVGLAVRTGVPLPSLRLSPAWWMLVVNEASALTDVSATEEKKAALSMTEEEGKRTPGTASEAEAVDRRRSRPSCLDEAAPISDNVTDKRASISAIDGVLAALERIGGTGAGNEQQLEKVLADARFVAPLSNGHMVELVPGGADRPVNTHNLGEYRARLARLRGSEYAPQAAAFREGLDSALPQRALSLLTWREMEKLVCG